MKEEEKNNKINEYATRHSFWTNQVLNQFGFSINLFLTIGIGIIAFLVSHRNEYPQIFINIHSEINWKLFFYLSSILLVFVSIIIGSASVISRLYDLRIMRHIIWVRKRVVKKLEKLLPEGFIDLTKDSLCKNFFRTISKKIVFIIDDDYNDFDQLKNKFENLRKQSKLLGEFSWRMHKIQIVFLLFSIVIYALTIL